MCGVQVKMLFNRFPHIYHTEDNVFLISNNFLRLYTTRSIRVLNIFTLSDILNNPQMCICVYSNTCERNSLSSDISFSFCSKITICLEAGFTSHRSFRSYSSCACARACMRVHDRNLPELGVSLDCIGLSVHLGIRERRLISLIE